MSSLQSCIVVLYIVPVYVAPSQLTAFTNVPLSINIFLVLGENTIRDVLHLNLL